MIWDDYREAADRSFNLPCTITHRVTGAEPLLHTEAGRASLLRELDAQTAAACARVTAIILQSRDALADVVGFQRAPQHLFPWALLPASGERDRRVQLLVLDSARRLVLRSSLIGQSYQPDVELLSLLGQNTGNDQYRSFTVYATEVAFGEGSFWKKVTAIIAFSASAIGILGFSPIKDEVDLIIFDYKVEKLVEGHTCAIETTWRFDGIAFRRMALASMDYGEPNITAEEKRLRVCNVQLALRIAQGSPEKIDGWNGPRTREALAAYAASRNVPPDIRNEALRGHLFREFRGKPSSPL